MADPERRTTSSVSRGRRRWLRVLLLLGVALLPLAAWGLLHARYHSWHPCDWLLQDRVSRVLRQRGIDPDTASIPLKATVAGSAEVQAALQLRRTPAECLSTWTLGRVFSGTAGQMGGLARYVEAERRETIPILRRRR